MMIHLILWWLPVLSSVLWLFSWQFLNYLKQTTLKKIRFWSVINIYHIHRIIYLFQDFWEFFSPWNFSFVSCSQLILGWFLTELLSDIIINWRYFGIFFHVVAVSLFYQIKALYKWDNFIFFYLLKKNCRCRSRGFQKWKLKQVQ